MNTGSLRARARDALRDHWGISLAAALVAGLLGGLHTGSVGLRINISEEILYQLPPIVISLFAAWVSVTSTLSLAQFIVGGTVQLGYTQFLLHQHDGRAYTFQELFSQFDRFSKGFLQRFLRVLYVVLWSLLFIIPGIIASYSYAMTPFLMVEHPELTPKQAIAASKEMMDGHKTDLFFLDLSFLGWDLLNVLTLGIGTLWLNPYRNAAYAAFYRELQAQNHTTSVE